MAPQTIPWSQIEAECSGYRQGFVATFRKYEGQPTDEKDTLGRTVKVTARSFALHAGIEPSTFRRWVTVAERAAPSPRSTNDLTRDVLRAARHKPEAVIQGILNAPQQTQDEIFHELKLRRAGEDRSPANLKAANAAAQEAVAPMRKAMASTHVELCIQALHDATESLAAAAAQNGLTSEAMLRIDKAHEAFVLARHEAAFKLEVGR